MQTLLSFTDSQSYSVLITL